LFLCLLHLCFRFDILKSGKETFRRDGINTIKYDRLTLDFKRLFTYILVTVNQTEIESVSKYVYLVSQARVVDFPSMTHYVV